MASKFEKITIGNCILVNADCYDVLPTLPEKFVSLVNTDPPYVVKLLRNNLAKSVIILKPDLVLHLRDLVLMVFLMVMMKKNSLN